MKISKFTNIMEIELRKIEKYSGLYWVNSAGYTFGHNGKKPLEIYDSNGEYKVRLLGKMVSVAMLVAETFIPRPKGNFLLRHKDGNPYNNCVDNLEWILNVEEKRKLLSERYHETKQRRLRGVRATYHLRKRIEVCKRNKYGRFERIDVVLGINNTANKYGVPRSAIYKCCKFEREKEEYVRAPGKFVYTTRSNQEKMAKKYSKEKTYKNLYKFRELVCRPF